MAAHWNLLFCYRLLFGCNDCGDSGEVVARKGVSLLNAENSINFINSTTDAGDEVHNVGLTPS
jgi:hypothetical protein